MLSRRMVPLPSSCTRGVSFGPSLHRYMPLMICSSVPGMQAGHRVVFVEQREVVVDVVLLLDHALEAVMHDHADFVGEGRVVAHAVGDGVGHDVAVAVLMLQALAVERRASRGAAQQEAPGLHVARGPAQVAHALKAEHRIVDVERHHDPVAGAVRGGRRDPAGHAAGLVDAFLQDLARLVFLVIGNLVACPGACTAGLPGCRCRSGETGLPCRKCGLRRPGWAPRAGPVPCRAAAP